MKDEDVLIDIITLCDEYEASEMMIVPSELRAWINEKTKGNN